MQLRYGYDPASNRTYRQDAVATAAGKNLDELYECDGLQRLRKYHQGRLADGNTRIESPRMQQGWVLDATGNWKNFTQFDPATPSQTLDQSRESNRFNEITAITTQVGTPWAVPTYDRNGNTTTIPKPANLAEGLLATYDAWNRLATVRTVASVNVVSYQYDGLNRRIAEKSYNTGGGLVETRHLYYSDQWQVLEERVDAATTAKAQYICGLRYIDDLVLRDRNTSGGTLNERLYALQDANWNVVALANTSGVVQERYGYTPYGVVSIYSGTWAVRTASSFAWNYLFQGGRFAATTGMSSFRNREYIVVLGAWAQRDPIGFAGGDLNRLRLIGSNPSNSTDPSGLYKITVKAAGFIPDAWFKEPEPFFSATGWQARGDNRTFDIYKVDKASRVYLIFSFDSSDVGKLKGPIKNVADSTGSQRRRRTSDYVFDVGDVFQYQYEYDSGSAKARGEVDASSWSKNAKDITVISFAVKATDPFYALLAPSITIRGTLILRRTCGADKIGADAYLKHTDYPNWEVYVEPENADFYYSYKYTSTYTNPNTLFFGLNSMSSAELRNMEL